MIQPLHIERALNYWKSEHTPAYLALRRYVVSRRNLSAETLLAALAAQSPDHTFRRHLTYKSSDCHGRPRYRQCVAAGPLVALAESWVLTILANEPSFARASNIYSHRWGAPESHQLFRHFMSGYRSRHADVAQALAEEPGLVALVTDISHCYDSIPFRNARSVYVERVLGSQMTRNERTISLGILATFDDFPSIPVGPPLGHILANVYLERLDRALIEKFGSRYFRYVDDIVVVCPQEQVEEVFDQISDELRKLDLALNNDKTAVLREKEWHEEVGTDAALGPMRPHAFWKLNHEVRRIIAAYPEAEVDVVRMLQSEGIALSPDVLSPNSMVSAGYVGRRRAIAALRSLVVETRQAYLTRLTLLANKFGHLPSPTRWHVQQIKNLIRPLLQLLPVNDHARIEAMVPGTHDFAEMRAVMRALAYRAPCEVYPYPGSATDFLSRLWIARGFPPVAEALIETASPSADAQFQLASTGVVRVEAATSFLTIKQNPAPTGTTTKCKGSVLPKRLSSMPTHAFTPD